MRIDPEVLSTLRGRERKEYVESVRKNMPPQTTETKEKPLPYPVVLADATEV